MESIIVSRTLLVLKRGDITLEDTDAIVNAANSSLMGGGGVDGAIHRGGGPNVLEECRKIRQRYGDLATGKAVITTGGNLKARYVIHTVGPVWQSGTHNEDHLLADTYRSSLSLAVRKRIRTIAFPSISTGAYGFPIERASRIAFSTVSDFVRENDGIDEVRFIVFCEGDFAVCARVFRSDRV